MNAAGLYDLLVKLAARKEILEWARGKPLDQAWEECERADWMLWLCERMIGNEGWPTRQQIVLVACDCAEIALGAWEKRYPKNPDLCKALEVTRAWAKGKATLEEVRHAAINVRLLVDIPSRDTASHFAKKAVYAATIAADPLSQDAAAEAAHDTVVAKVGGFRVLFFSRKYKKLADMVREKLDYPALTRFQPQSEGGEMAHQSSKGAAPNDVADMIATPIGSSFSSTRFTDVFKGQSMAEGWTLGDALAVWYSLGHFALVVAAWSVYNDQTQVSGILDLCRPRLVKLWNVPPDVLDKLRTVVNETEAAAFASYSRCNKSNDLSLFFSRYVSRILGAPVPFSERDMFEDQLMGIKYLGSDPILCIAVCKLFVGVCVEIKELLG